MRSGKTRGRRRPVLPNHTARTALRQRFWDSHCQLPENVCVAQTKAQTSLPTAQYETNVSIQANLPYHRDLS